MPEHATKWNRKKVGEGAKVSEECADERIERSAGRLRSREEPWLGKKRHGSGQGVREVVCAPGAHCAGVAHFRFWLWL